MLRVLEQLLGGGHLHDATQIHDRDTVSDAANGRQVVTDEQVADFSLSLQLLQQRDDRARTDWSRLAVGSSSTTMSGSHTSARAIATRCCCPPESSRGRRLRYSGPSPTAFSDIDDALSTSFPSQRSCAGSATVRATVKCGFRDWSGMLKDHLRAPAHRAVVHVRV